MTLSMYQASVPVFSSMLNNLAAILKKAEDYAAAKKIDPVVLLNARLAPDMFPMVRQVQIATDIAKGCAARLAGIDVPSYEDNEQTFADLQARVEKTVKFIESVDPKAIDGSEDRAISLKMRSGDLNFKGQEYLLYFATPNLYFHVTTAYAILRHNGLEIGKMDFLGAGAQKERRAA